MGKRANILKITILLFEQYVHVVGAYIRLEIKLPILHLFSKPATITLSVSVPCLPQSKGNIASPDSLDVLDLPSINYYRENVHNTTTHSVVDGPAYVEETIDVEHR